jgi:Xaa-Pro aminopeptidase
VTRARRVAGQLSARGIDALLVCAPVNVRYLTGFTGSNALVLIAAQRAKAPAQGRDLFLTDFRYATQAAEQVPDAFTREVVEGDLLDAAARALTRSEDPWPRRARERAATGEDVGAGRLGEGGGTGAGRTGRLGFDEQALTVARHSRLRELLGPAWELIPCAGTVERLRAVKDRGEIARIRAAAQLADEALRGLLEAGVVGRSERDVAIELEARMRRLGAEAMSFPSIVAAGAHAALPHAEPRAVEIPKDVLLTIDWGAAHEGYCSDCTRTYATGEGITTQARQTYELVLGAQEQALAAVRAGPTGRELDAVARAVIEGEGHGEHFGHGLGHGVGMEVHEAPRLSRTAGEQPLQAGNVVTIEPGVYLPGRLGVRIEDLVVVTADGHEALSGLPKTFTVIC